MATNNNYSSQVQVLLKNRKVQSATPIIFSIITITILAMFAIRPTVKTILDLQHSVNEQTTILNKLQQKSKNIETGITAYNAIADPTKIKMLSLIPSSTALACLVNNFNSYAQSNQVQVNGFQIQPVDLRGITKCQLDSNDLEAYRKTANPDNTAKEITFSLNAQGSYTQLVNFITDISSHDRLVSIESINMNKSEDGSLMVSIIGKAYFYQ